MYLWQKTITRDVLYVVVSALVMFVCGTYLPNCGIYEQESAAALAEEAQQKSIVRAIQAETETDEEARQNAIIRDAVTLAVEAQARRRNSRSNSINGSRRSSNSRRGSGSHSISIDPSMDSGGGMIELSPPSVVSEAKADGPPSALMLATGAVSSSLASTSTSASASGSAEAEEYDDSESLNAQGTRSPRSGGRGDSYMRACSFLLGYLCSWRLFFRVYVASLVSLAASICFWTGAYNLLLEVFLWLANENETAAYTLNLVLGWALMWLTGTLFEQAGLDRGVVAPSAVPASAAAAAGAPAILPPPDAPGSLQPYHSSFEKRVRVYVRATLAITGTMMFWLGASMLLEQASEVYYHDTSDKPVPQESSRESRTALHCHECTESTPTRNAVFVLLGLALFVVTDTMAVHAGVEESIQQTAALVADVNAQQQDMASSSQAAAAAPSSSSSSSTVVASASLPRASRSARLLSHPLMKHVRALSSLLGVMMLWEGLWDAAFTPEAEAAGWGRMLVYTFVGLFGLQLTDSLFANSGVVPPFSINKRRTAVQQRLGYQLEEQKILRAGAGGQAHDPDMLAQYDARQQQHQPQQPPPQATTVPSFAAPAPQQPLPQRQQQYHPHGTILSASAAHQQQLQNGLSSALSMALDGIPPSPVLTPPVDHTAALAQSKAPFSALKD
jgi:hypothetical protein